MQVVERCDPSRRSGVAKPGRDRAAAQVSMILAEEAAWPNPDQHLIGPRSVRHPSRRSGVAKPGQGLAVGRLPAHPSRRSGVAKPGPSAVTSRICSDPSRRSGVAKPGLAKSHRAPLGDPSRRSGVAKPGQPWGWRTSEPSRFSDGATGIEVFSLRYRFFSSNQCLKKISPNPCSQQVQRILTRRDQKLAASRPLR